MATTTKTNIRTRDIIDDDNVTLNTVIDEINSKTTDWADVENKPTFSTVSLSGKFEDLIGIPLYKKITKLDDTTSCFYKYSSDMVKIKAGTKIYNGESVFSYNSDTTVTMPSSLVHGKDYTIYCDSSGNLKAYKDTLGDTDNDTVPDGALKVGGFHYQLAITTTLSSYNTTVTNPLISYVWTSADISNLNGINKYSIWDLNYRPKCDPRGMICIDNNFWIDIYFCGTNHISNGTSKAGTNVASGTVLPLIPLSYGGNGATTYTTLKWYEANEIAKSVHKRLPKYDEFCVAAFGVTENKSLGGSETTITATAHAHGYMSKWGMEQATGHHWCWGEIAHGSGDSSWVSGAGRGQTYGTPYGARFGSARGNGSCSGSRSVSLHYAPWNSLWDIGLRCACDHLSL